MSHITGGGIPGNLPRVLPEGLGAAHRRLRGARADLRSLAARGGVAEGEMRRTFNVGVGFVFVVDGRHRGARRRAARRR